MNSHSLRRPATTTNFLPDDVLLEVFDLFRIEEATTSRRLPWKWQRLAHVCRTWRDIILASSSRLNLELLCTHGTPVRNNLRHFPPFPIVIHFPGTFLVSRNEDNVNILAALEHPDRIRNIKLSLPCLLVGNVVTVMQRPFPALTHLWLHSRDDGHTLVIPDSFLGGCAPRLQEIYLDGISFPAAPTLLSSACNLVDIHFYNIPNTGYISPEAMAASLTALSRLKHLTFRLQWQFWPDPDQISQPPITRTVLPALTTFFFNGFFEYLEEFVAQIETPQLHRVGIEYLDGVLDFDFRIPQLCMFIDRSEKLKQSQSRHVDLEFQPGTFVIDWGRSSLKLSIQFNGITGFLSQICGTPSNVDSLFIISRDYEDSGIEPDDDIEWLEVLRPFTVVKTLRVRNQASRCVALELGKFVGEETAGVLPALELLCLEKQPATSVEGFVAARRNVGRPVTFANKRSEFQERLEPNQQIG
ncbi:hypothetical protein EDB89DRAFT_179680 [Lactarius sanguifluus]|nr:hypothetical protein EDB89DRAFT_179680 [Lactarius sanguifluus]